MRFYGLLSGANQKARKAIDNVRVNLNKIHLRLKHVSFPLIHSRHLTILGSCHCKKKQKQKKQTN